MSDEALRECSWRGGSLLGDGVESDAEIQLVDPPDILLLDIFDVARCALGHRGGG